MTDLLTQSSSFGGIASGAFEGDTKIIQRIPPRRLSDSVKERRMADADADLVLQT